MKVNGEVKKLEWEKAYKDHTDYTSICAKPVLDGLCKYEIWTGYGDGKWRVVYNNTTLKRAIDDLDKAKAKAYCQTHLEDNLIKSCIVQGEE